MSGESGLIEPECVRISIALPTILLVESQVKGQWTCLRVYCVTWEGLEHEPSESTKVPETKADMVCVCVCLFVRLCVHQRGGRGDI